MATERVLQIGMDPAVIDFSPWPGQNAEALRVRIDAAESALREAGFDVTVCLLADDVDAAETTVRNCFAHNTFDVVEVGSGLRASHDYTEIFERVVNAVVELAPRARFCFNDSPETTLAAVNRAVLH